MAGTATPTAPSTATDDPFAYDPHAQDAYAKLRGLGWLDNDPGAHDAIAKLVKLGTLRDLSGGSVYPSNPGDSDQGGISGPAASSGGVQSRFLMSYAPATPPAPAAPASIPPTSAQPHTIQNATPQEIADLERIGNEATWGVDGTHSPQPAPQPPTVMDRIGQWAQSVIDAANNATWNNPNRRTGLLSPISTEMAVPSAALAPIANAPRNFVQGATAPGLQRMGDSEYPDGALAQTLDAAKNLFTDIPGNVRSGLSAVFYDNGPEMIGRQVHELTPGTIAGTLYNTLTAMGSDPLNFALAPTNLHIPGIAELGDAARAEGAAGVGRVLTSAAANAGPSAADQLAETLGRIAQQAGQAGTRAAYRVVVGNRIRGIEDAEARAATEAAQPAQTAESPAPPAAATTATPTTPAADRQIVATPAQEATQAAPAPPEASVSTPAPVEPIHETIARAVAIAQDPAIVADAFGGETPSPASILQAATEHHLDAMTAARQAAETPYYNGQVDPLDPQPYGAYRAAISQIVPPAQQSLFQVHGLGVTDGQQSVEQNLHNLLTTDIDPSRPFQSGPPLGSPQGGLNTKTDAPYLILSDPGKSLEETGIKNVIVNGAAQVNLPTLRQTYPGVNFLTPEQAAQAMAYSVPEPQQPQPQSNAVAPPPASSTPAPAPGTLPNVQALRQRPEFPQYLANVPDHQVFHLSGNQVRRDAEGNRIPRYSIADYTGPEASLYHEAPAAAARSVIGSLETGRGDLGGLYVADDPNLAIGQKGSQASRVMLVLDPTRVNGVPNNLKPGLAFTRTHGGGDEYLLNRSLPGAVKAIRVKTLAQAQVIARDPAVARLFDFSAPKPIAKEHGGGFFIARTSKGAKASKANSIAVSPLQTAPSSTMPANAPTVAPTAPQQAVAPPQAARATRAPRTVKAAATGEPSVTLNADEATILSGHVSDTLAEKLSAPFDADDALERASFTLTPSEVAEIRRFASSPSLAASDPAVKSIRRKFLPRATEAAGAAKPVTAATAATPTESPASAPTSAAASAGSAASPGVTLNTGLPLHTDPLPGDVAQRVGAMGREVIGALSPGGLSKQAAVAARIIRQRNAERARSSDQAQYTVDRGPSLLERARGVGRMVSGKAKRTGQGMPPESLRHAYENLPEKDRWEIYTRAEQGLPQANPARQRMADELLAMFQYRETELENLPHGAFDSFRDNYLPHLWENDRNRQEFLSGLLSRASVPSGFKRARTFDTIADGIAAGLRPISTNLVDLALLRAQQVDKYLMMHRIFGDLQAEGYLKHIGPSEPVPPGYAAVNHHLFAVTEMRPTTKADGTPGAPERIDRGRHVMPEGVAQVVSNFLEPGLGSSPTYQTIREMAGGMVQANLSISGFHGMLTSFNAVASDIGAVAHNLEAAITAAIQKRGGDAALSLKEAGKAAGRALVPPVGLGRDYVLGRTLAQGWLDPSLLNPETKKVVDALVSGGIRLHPERQYTLADVQTGRGAAERALRSLLKGHLLDLTFRRAVPASPPLPRSPAMPS